MYTVDKQLQLHIVEMLLRSPTWRSIHSLPTSNAFSTNNKTRKSLKTPPCLNTTSQRRMGEWRRAPRIHASATLTSRKRPPPSPRYQFGYKVMLTLELGWAFCRRGNKNGELWTVHVNKGNLIKQTIRWRNAQTVRRQWPGAIHAC